jgi:hypothetical protein
MNKTMPEAAWMVSDIARMHILIDRIGTVLVQSMRESLKPARTMRVEDPELERVIVGAGLSVSTAKPW